MATKKRKAKAARKRKSGPAYVMVNGRAEDVGTIPGIVAALAQLSNNIDTTNAMVVEIKSAVVALLDRTPRLGDVEEAPPG